jgi:hypothetical protein
MKRILTIGTLAAVAVSGAAVVTAGSAGQAQSPAPEAGFTALFNGRDFTGWKLATPESFRIENGAIVANGAPGHAYYDGPFLDHAFRDFELRTDVMTRTGANGGIYVMTEFQERGFPAKGFEIQVNNSYERDPVKTGSLYHVLDVTETAAKDDEWFTETIIARGMTITVLVNGVETAKWTQPEDWQGTFRRSGRPEFPERRLQPGTIALQAHDADSTVYYRNIRIRAFD